MTEPDLRQRYAEAIVASLAQASASPALANEVVAAAFAAADAVLAELNSLREENAGLLMAVSPSKVKAGRRIVDSLTRIVRIERDDARADRDRWRERAEKAEAELASARNLCARSPLCVPDEKS